MGGPPSLKHCFGDLLDISLPYRIREPVLTQAPAISAVHPPQMYRVGMVIIGALIIRIGFGVYYTLNMIRKPQNPFLIIKAPISLAISPHGPCKLMVQRTPPHPAPGTKAPATGRPKPSTQGRDTDLYHYLAEFPADRHLRASTSQGPTGSSEHEGSQQRSSRLMSYWGLGFRVSSDPFFGASE